MIETSLPFLSGHIFPIINFGDIKNSAFAPMYEASRRLSFWENPKFCNQITEIFSRQKSIFEHNIPWSYAILIIKRTSHSFITTNSRGAHNWTKELANFKKKKKETQNTLNPVKQNIKIQQLKSFLERFIAHKTPNTTLTQQPSTWNLNRWPACM